MHLHKPIPAQKELISKAGLNPEDWLVERENEDYLYLRGKNLVNGKYPIQIIDKATGNLAESRENALRMNGCRA